MKKVLDLLKNNIDTSYKEFNSSLIPNVDKKFILGVRIPIIRKIEKSLSFEEKKKFLSVLPHKYFEENILHAIIISNLKDLDDCLLELDNFLDYVDNWSVCDTLICKVLNNDLDRTFSFLEKCLLSDSVYRVRFAFVMMLRYFVKTKYIDKCNSICINYKSDEYYINMAIAWYFSYALIFAYDNSLYIFENKILDKWLHNKSIQKAIESYRISEDRKSYLNSLRIK